MKIKKGYSLIELIISISIIIFLSTLVYLIVEKVKSSIVLKKTEDVAVANIQIRELIDVVSINSKDWIDRATNLNQEMIDKTIDIGLKSWSLNNVEKVYEIDDKTTFRINIVKVSPSSNTYNLSLENLNYGSKNAFINYSFCRKTIDLFIKDPHLNAINDKDIDREINYDEYCKNKRLLTLSFNY